ncbi:3-hydroxyacyl-CoA dehydrogenase NAD-binding domain-containing protein [Bartonella sp. HY329]|uniref:3-hydroxyacyl-CoA dehydrogenase NAD-binding domain-containing protein n=1 Tax=unclassified Bartonella TaxID=2645622 RepID=UPI0021C58155|nr:MULTISPECIES: 3-hydroxyacyl-CoA dehydrogenase NAD-binding domain-containing protein [unclassified Bartonella]UXM94666.1 3-hydroxyacyl-CoA dehydrogenase NAD-binding domain-containing protein [Bartonella sp. HY329]UXN08989.1 3-hydroxyacyl-CoA dehydrogenase NAD-binding domain-containing protein [Bartonella sp. HY328]
MGIKNITVIGTGTIGMSWILFYLSKGFHVTANDIAPQADEKIRAFIKNNWKDISAQSGSIEDAFLRFNFTEDLEDALRHADFVHENGPENLNFKQQLFAKIDAVLAAHIGVASSTSGIPMSAMQEALTLHPERFFIAHPFNPPHIMPLVEILGGEKTDPKILKNFVGFFNDLGKKAVLLKKELPGHVANRIAWALWKEVLWLIQEDAISVTDVDTVVSAGPGLRWGVMGPNLLYHLGGGAGGIEHFLDQFGDQWNEEFKKMQNPELNSSLRQKLIEGIKDEVGEQSISQLEEKRNQVLLGLIDLKKKANL